ESIFDFSAGGVRGIADERIADQDDPAQTVAALKSLLFDKRLLDGMQSVRLRKAVESPETFKGSYAVPVGVGDRRHAGADGPSVEQNGACAALSESAAEFGAVELEILLQYVKQGSRWVVNGYVGMLSVDLQYVDDHRNVLAVGKKLVGRLYLAVRAVSIGRETGVKAK